MTESDYEDARRILTRAYCRAVSARAHDKLLHALRYLRKNYESQIGEPEFTFALSETISI